MAEQDWLTPATAPAPSPYYNVAEAPGLAAPAYELRPLSLGELLDRTFSLYRSRFWLFAGIASMAAAVELVFAALGRILLHHYSKDSATLYGGALIVTYIAGTIYFFVYSVTQAATSFAMAEAYLSRPVTIGTAMRAVIGKWYAWIGIGIWQAWSAGWILMALFVPFIAVTALKIAFGPSSEVLLIVLMVLLFIGAAVYGVIAYIRNSLAAPVKVVEGGPVRRAMRRSKALSDGAKGRIFVLGLIVWALNVGAGIAQMPFALMTVMYPKTSHIFSEMAVLFITFAAHSLITPVVSIGLCLVYFDQRVRREAFDLDFLLGPDLPPSPTAEYPAAEAPTDAPLY
jgi:hypothetical protein